MSIQLRQDEKIECEAQFHWSAFIVPAIWAAFMSLALIGIMASPEFNGGAFFMVASFGYAPLTYVWLQNKNKAYVVTNQRLYVEMGILSKTKTDIPTHKINDINLNQDIVQRLFGAGNIAIMTGNDKPTKLMNIDRPEQFREVLSNICSKKTAA